MTHRRALVTGADLAFIAFFMCRFLRPFACLLLTAAAFAQTTGLVGRLDGENYVSPTGAFRMRAPVLPELGGEITDTENVVTFSDDFGTHVSVACFPLDLTQKWELETRGLKDYLTYFFATFVLADFQTRFPGSRIETALFSPELAGGALLVHVLLPGGSFFDRTENVAAEPVTAKRGNLCFVHANHVYVISTELSERAIQRSAHRLTPEQENARLRERLIALHGRITFTPAKPATAR